MIINFKIFEGSVKKSDRIDIFRDDKYIVVAPLTEEASMKYGADSHWCTSASGSGAWCDESKPNNENSTVGLIILIRRNYKMTPRNEENSELYYYLFRKEENGEVTKRERNKLEVLREDDDYLNMSKLTITFSINSNGHGEVWAANNIHLDWIYSLYDLVSYGIDDYVIEEIDNYISSVRKTKKFTLNKNIGEVVYEGKKISGIPLKKMSKETFEWWVGSENVVNGKIKVFRGTNVKNAGLRTGDFVTTNKIYAGKYGPYVEEFDIPVKYLNYFSGVKGGDPEQLHAWNLGKKAQPTELIYTGELISEKFILERKQLGTIYHFTHSLWGLSCILEEDELRSGEFDGISFTRNKNMWNIQYLTRDDNDRYKIRISFDGDRMSDRWKFEPFLYDSDFDFKDEAEERVLWDSMYGIRKYITKITFRRKSLERGDVTKIRNLKKEYPEIKFEII